jgi:hypothetical protein
MAIPHQIIPSAALMHGLGGIKVSPGINVVLDRTMAKAEDRKAAIDASQSVEEQLRHLATMSRIDITLLRDNLDKALPVDALPPDARFNSGTGWRQSMVDLAPQQRRGIFHRDYGHALLRDSLAIGPGRPIPKAAATVG